MPPALEAGSLNHWTAREVLSVFHASIPGVRGQAGRCLQKGKGHDRSLKSEWWLRVGRGQPRPPAATQREPGVSELGLPPRHLTLGDPGTPIRPL